LIKFEEPTLNFPLTPEQLNISLSGKNRVAFKIVSSETNLAIGHSEIYLSDKE